MNDFGSRKSCPACLNNSYTTIQVGLVSPWVLQIAKLQSGLRQTALRSCTNCRSAYFDLSYGDHVVKSLYEKYRGEDYFRIRNSWETSYTSKLNSGLSHDEDWMNWRREAVEKVLLGAGVDLNHPIVCVDIGGGEGGVIPNFPNGKKFVLDSNLALTLPKGVSRISDYAQLVALKPNLIMSCGLLEHLNSPNEFLQDLLLHSRDTSLYYFEVPAGIPMPRLPLASMFFYQKIITSSRFLWKLMHLIDSKLTRSGYGSVFPLKLSEHLNFFSEHGLIELLERNGLEVVSINGFATNHKLPGLEGLAFIDAIQILGRRNN